MKFEGSLAGKRRIAVCELEHLVKHGEKRCCRRKKVCVPKTAVQWLFDTCREVFGGPGTVPLPRDVLRLQFILDRMRPADVGLSEELLFFLTSNVAQGTPRVKYMHIYQCHTFSMGIFLLPPSATIPLHNHPGMTVFSKLLLGSMHLKAYDWVEDPVNPNESMPSSQLGLARLKVDGVYTAPCDTSVLFPAAGGNIHSLLAVTPCAVLDVLGPPYTDGRDSTYYRDYPFSRFSSDETSGEEGDACYGWLEVIEKPEDFVVDGAKYRGPQVVEGC